jgi:prevent-host-death family protein
MLRIKASDARQDFAELLNRVAYSGERIVLHRRGKNVAALVSLEDLELLKAIEDRLDNQAAEAAHAEGGEPVPWEKVKADLGIK